MQVSPTTSQLPSYHSPLLKKQRHSKLLSPKVTHVHPQINSVSKIILKKHHLDDTEMKLALQYDYEQNPLPKQYFFQGERLDYDKNHYNNHIKSPRRMSGQSSREFTYKNSNGFARTPQGNLKLNTEYFETQHNFNPSHKPQKDGNQDQNSSHRQFEKYYQTQTNDPTSRLKKSISVADFDSLRRDQHQMQQKVIVRLNQIQTLTDRINKNIQHIQNSKQKQKSAHNNDPLIARYKSQTKGSSAEKKFSKLKEKLERQRTKEKKRLEAQLDKIKQERKRIKEEERKRKRSFKQIMQNQQPNSKYLENLMIQQANNLNSPFTARRTKGQDNMIEQKIIELQRKYLPKTNVVNKRIQCEIYDPRTDHLRRLQEKPMFLWEDRSDTDSQFSDF